MLRFVPHINLLETTYLKKADLQISFNGIGDKEIDCTNSEEDELIYSEKEDLQTPKS